MSRYTRGLLWRLRTPEYRSWNTRQAWWFTRAVFLLPVAIIAQLIHNPYAGQYVVWLESEGDDIAEEGRELYDREEREVGP